MKKSEHVFRQNPGYKLITVENPNCYASEAFRRIKVCMDSLSLDGKNQVVQICSALPGDGKTTTLLNMAITYAESGKRVALIDMDLRKPKMHRAFHLENVGGLTDYLTSGTENLTDIIKHTSYKNIDFICAGPSPIRPATLLSSEKLEKIIGEMRNYYDIILIDEPPIIISPDCCMIARFCDCAIFQISRKNTDTKAAKKAVKMLRQNGVNIIGCVFTEVDNETESYSYHYKY